MQKMKISPDEMLAGVRGYAALFNQVIPRLFGDQVFMKGAFSDWPQEIPLIWSHNVDRYPVGSTFLTQEDDIGLYFEGVIVAGDGSQGLIDRIGQRLITGVSHQAPIDQYRINEKEDTIEIERFGDPLEISMTLIPANPRTNVEIFKLTDDLKNRILTL